MMTSVVESEDDLLKKFNSQKFYFSYSSLNKLLYNPKLFYNWYILQEKEESLDPHLLEGKVIHCLLLEPKKFEEQFSILPGKIPTATNKKVVEAMFRMSLDNPKTPNNLNSYNKEILEWLQTDNTHQNLKDDKDLTKADAKTGDQKRLDKVLIPESQSYFDYLVESNGKTVIDRDIYEKCEESVEIIKENKQICDLLAIDNSDFELQEAYYELPISTDLEDYNFGIKGIIDNLVIDHESKVIIVNDLKTTGKTLSEFRDTIEYYNYSIQAAIYIELVKGSFEERIKDINEYEIHFNFIVIDKFNQVYPFGVSKATLDDYKDHLERVLEVANYHYTNQDYNLPYEFAKNLVIL